MTRRTPLQPTPSAVFLGIALLVFALNCIAAPVTVGWRDSGEFILTSFFLDIPHPAGFPTYSVFSNLVSLLVPGPIAWRTHIFSAICVVGIGYQTFKFALELGDNHPQITRLAPYCVAIVSASIFITESAQRGFLTAEVYPLNALLLISITRYLARYLKLGDIRYLYSSAVLGGLALGNHVFAAAFGLLAGAVIFSHFALKKLLPSRAATADHVATISRQALATTAIFVLIGASVYCYLPIRASTNPPLNTGSPNTISRLFNVVTNSRDWALKPQPKSESTTSTAKPSKLVQLQSDLKRLVREVSWPIAAFALIGLLIMVRSEPFVVSLCGGTIAITLLLFAGWDSDPWIVAVAAVYILANVTLLHILSIRWAQNSKVLAAVMPAICATTLALLFYPTIASSLFNDDGDEIARATGVELLSSAPDNSLLVVEPSWFIARYLQAIEGLRPDLAIVYQPALLFPRYFAPVKLAIADKQFTSLEGSAPNEPQLKNVFELINLASPSTTIQIEPQSILTTPLREILQFEDDGGVRIYTGRQTTVSSKFAQRRGKFVGSLLQYASQTDGTLGSDTRNYALVVFTQTFQALIDAELRSEACQFGAVVKNALTDNDLTIKRYINERCEKIGG